MPLQNDLPLTSTFVGCQNLQCMGTAYAPASYPNGVAGSMEFEGGWFKATIRQTDPPTFSGIRSEIVLFTSQALGDEIIYSWEMFIKSSEWTDHTGDIILGQLHPEDTILSAVGFAFAAKNGVLTFDTPLNDPPTTSFATLRTIVGDLKLDHLYKMAVRMKCLNNAAGYLQAFVDGVQVYQRWNRATSYNADSPYLKLGIYDGPHNADFGTKSARFRNVRRYSGIEAYSEFLDAPPLPIKRLVGV